MKIEINQPIAIHEIGKRQNQEDAIYPSLDEATIEDKFFILCDGMGGHDYGEVASNMVCNVIASYIHEKWDGIVFPDSLLYDALNEAVSHLDIIEYTGLRKPGTTLTFLCIHRGGVIVAHIGDSRIYHIRPSEHRILYKSRDHSLAYDMFLAGEITFDEIGSFDRKNVITRALMPCMENQVRADVAHIADICSGDYFYLCSDGMLENMTDNEIIEMLCLQSNDKEKRDDLIKATKDNKDNHSAYLIRIDGVEFEKGDEALVNDEDKIRCNAVLLENENRYVKHNVRPNECHLTTIEKIWEGIIKLFRKRPKIGKYY